MPTLRVTTPAPAQALAASSRRTVVVTNSATSVRLDVPETGFALSNNGVDWVQVDRGADRFPLVRRGQRRLKKLRLNSVQLGHNAAIAHYYLDLIAASTAAVRIAYGPSDGPIARRLWRITEFTTEPQQLSPADDGIVEATYSIEFMEYIHDQASTPSRAPAAKPAPTAKTRIITVTVKKGDTLSKIAARYLGSADRWREIATLNKLRNPNRIYPGQRLKVKVAA